MAAMAGVLVDLGGVPAAGPSAPYPVVLAQTAPPPGKGAEFGEASPIGLVVILLLAVATIFLIRSMTKRIRRLPASFDPPQPPAEPDADDGRPTPAARGEADTEDQRG